MQISDILKPEAIKLLDHTTSKKRLLQEVADTANLAYDLGSDDVFEALQARESLGPTGVGGGIALPHARLPGLEKIHGVFVRLEKPLAFESIDKQPVDLIFTLFAPEEAGAEHLKALALVSRTMRNEEICAKLRANSDSSALFAILTEGPTTKAA
ncbi:MAG: PTS IIA-like nitrogen regulatory protein PtsN [Brevirhabdus sp.]